MKHLCIDARMLYASGIGTYLKNILRHLPRFLPVKMTLLVDDKYTHSLDFLPNYQIVPCRSDIYSLYEQMELPVKIPQCDLFWSPHFNTPFFPIRAKLRVVTIHDVFHLAHANTFTLPQKLYVKAMIRWATRASSLIFTVSDFSKKEIMAYTPTPKEKIEVIPNGIDPNLFRSHSSQEGLQSIRKKYDLSHPFVIYVGNLKPHKNLPRLLEAFHLFLQHGSSHHNLLLVGKSFKSFSVLPFIEQVPLLQQRVKILSRVTDDELPLLYQLAAAAILPSLYEGFGLPPLEAMSCGCPAIAAKVASLPEVCGEAAYYINPYDPKNIADGIREVLSNGSLRNELQFKGLKKAQEFRWEKTAQRYAAVLKERFF